MMISLTDHACRRLIFCQFTFLLQIKNQVPFCSECMKFIDCKLGKGKMSEAIKDL
jgi:hypothetical protein